MKKKCVFSLDADSNNKKRRIHGPYKLQRSFTLLIAITGDFVAPLWAHASSYKVGVSSYKVGVLNLSEGVISCKL